MDQPWQQTQRSNQAKLELLNHERAHNQMFSETKTKNKTTATTNKNPKTTTENKRLTETNQEDIIYPREACQVHCMLRECLKTMPGVFFVFSFHFPPAFPIYKAHASAQLIGIFNLFYRMVFPDFSILK